MSQRWTVPGSQRVLPASSRVLGDADPNAESTVTLIVRSRRSEAPPPGAMSREAFAREYGADDADLQKVEAFARTHGLSVVERSVGRRSIVLRGTVAQMSAAFGVHLRRCETGGVTFRGREGSLSVPADLEGIVVAVLGLDDRPQAEPRVRIAAQPQTSFTPVQVASLYDFPAGVTGTGQCIAILELGGGFTQADYDTYLSSLGVKSQSVAIVSVDGGRNAPGEDSDADVEVMMDAEIAGAVAPGASLVIYFAPNTDQGFVDAVTTAVHDSTHKPSVISISWGAPEPNWTQQARERAQQRHRRCRGGRRNRLRRVGRRRVQRRSERRSVPCRLSVLESLRAGLRRHDVDARRVRASRPKAPGATRAAA